MSIFIASGESTCDECGQDLGRHAWITLQPDPLANGHDRLDAREQVRPKVMTILVR